MSQDDDPMDVRLRRAVATWTRAEDALMATLQLDPMIYQAALGVMARVLDHVRATVTDLEGLLAAEHTSAVLAIAREGSPSIVDPATAIGAALAMRHRELVYESQLAQRRAAIAEAQRAGDAWATLGRGRPGGSEMPVGSEELLVHIASGLAVSATTEFHLDTGSILFVARPVRVDVETGAIVGAAEEAGEERVASDRTALDERVAELVADIERLTGLPISDKR